MVKHVGAQDETLPVKTVAEQPCWRPETHGQEAVWATGAVAVTLAQHVAKKARPITFDAVREIGLALPGAEESSTYGSPALKVGGKMFACMAIHKSAEANSLAV